MLQGDRRRSASLNITGSYVWPGKPTKILRDLSWSLLIKPFYVSKITGKEDSDIN